MGGHHKIVQGESIDQLKCNSQNGIMPLNLKTKKLTCGSYCSRLTEVDVIPSPYLTGLMDQWFNGSYAPSIETSRGCPFTCGYCFAGQNWYNSIANFSVRRIKEESTYIANKMKNFPGILFSICDSNFGMYERDEEIAKHFSQLRKELGWPNAFGVTFNVLHPGHLRLLRLAKECGNRLVVGVLSDRVAAHAAHVPEQLRLEGVRSNNWVDEAFPNYHHLQSVIL